MNFEKDIFISYAHLDNNSMDDGMEGWISDFEKQLRIVVGELLAKPPIIWRDEKLQGNDDFAPEIVAQFPKLKVMVSIVTPRYVTSEWCAREVVEFCKAAEQTGGIKVENKARIFKIHKTPVDLNAEPEQIRGYLGYDFFNVDPATEKFVPYDKTYGPEMERAYHAKILDVAQDITRLINKLSSVTASSSGSNQEGKATNGTSFSGNGAKRKIYLANTTYDLKEYHESLKRELEDRGFIVFPNKNLPMDTADIFKSEAETFIKDSSLSIHLVGSTYGLVPDKTDKSIVVLQNELAAKESAERGLNRLIWIPPSTTSSDARQQTFIDQLKHSEELQHDSDLLEGTIEEFKFAIIDTIRKQEEKEKAAAQEKEKQKQGSAPTDIAAATDALPRLIYLICDQRDLNDTKNIEDFLFNSGHEVMLPIFEGDESQLRNEHEENLRQSDAIILYYGNANELWVRSMMRDLLRLPALGRTKPLLSKIAYLGNPYTPQKERFRSNELTVVNGLTGFNPQTLNDFLQKTK